MSVYITPSQLRRLPGHRTVSGSKTSRLFATGLEELQRFVMRASIHAQWFGDVKVPHYLVNESQRDELLRLGAIAVTDEQYKLFVAKHNQQGDTYGST